MRASHILIEYKHIDPDPKRGELSRSEAMWTAQELWKRVTDGESFAELAKLYSQCPSRDDGGDLGEFLPGDMSPAFDREVQRLTVGQLASPIISEHGVHLILRTG